MSDPTPSGHGASSPTLLLHEETGLHVSFRIDAFTNDPSPGLASEPGVSARRDMNSKERLEAVSLSLHTSKSYTIQAQYQSSASAVCPHSRPVFRPDIADSALSFVINQFQSDRPYADRMFPPMQTSCFPQWWSRRMLLPLQSKPRNDNREPAARVRCSSAGESIQIQSKASR